MSDDWMNPTRRQSPWIRMLALSILLLGVAVIVCVLVAAASHSDAATKSVEQARLAACAKLPVSKINDCVNPHAPQPKIITKIVTNTVYRNNPDEASVAHALHECYVLAAASPANAGSFGQCVDDVVRGAGDTYLNGGP